MERVEGEKGWQDGGRDMSGSFGLFVRNGLGA